MKNICSVLLTSVAPAGAIVAAAYQCLMALNGPEGFHQAARLEAEREQLAQQVASLTEERTRLEERADRLELVNLDEDLLEQSVRANLGHMRPGEYRIPMDDLDQVATAEISDQAELTSLIAVALLENAGA